MIGGSLDAREKIFVRFRIYRASLPSLRLSLANLLDGLIIAIRTSLSEILKPRRTGRIGSDLLFQKFQVLSITDATMGQRLNPLFLGDRNVPRARPQ